jgi:DNA primase
MPGRIRDEDVALVRERARIDEVIGEQVQLRNAGGGNLKGLCPFHDEKSPSLSVSPGRGLFHCFGCSEGGDVIRFVERIEHLSFTEAVEKLAARVGIQLRYADGAPTGSQHSGQRSRLIEAHAAAAAFYAEQLATPAAAKAREFLAERGFDDAASRRFGCGYAPDGWDALTKHLIDRGFKPAELTLAGLARESGRGSLIDRFHRRLLWPIRDVSGDVVGFGARRLYDDDKIEAKYLNTPETPIYKKSQLLYGMDVARREIAKQHRAVIVEGYTDVMACHLAGVTTAVATCGTAFGSDHVALLRRLLLDSDVFTGEVIFTFDGDAAGMKAAERAFGDDQKFMSQTFIAVEASGKDPCELRQVHGDAAVRALVDARRPLVEFVLKTVVARHNLDSAEGRVAALDQTVPLVATIKDHALRDEYARRLAGLVGVDEPTRVVSRVRGLVRATERAPARPSSQRHPTGGQQQSAPPQSTAAGASRPAQNPAESRPPTTGVAAKVAQTEREVLKAVLQLPQVIGAQFDTLGADAFLIAVHQQLHAAISAAGGASDAVAGPGWVQAVMAHLPPESEARAAVNALAVEALFEKADQQPGYARAMVGSLGELVLGREMAVLRSRLQRAEAAGEAAEAASCNAELLRLEQRRRELRDQAVGGPR